MTMWSASVEIDEAVRRLKISDEQFRKLPVEESSRIICELKRRYCGGKNAEWWWEHYSNATSWESEAEAYTLLPRICPDPEVLIVPHEGDEEQVYMTTPNVVSRVLGECAAFEYSIAGTNLDWLLTENHHGILFAVGQKAQRKLEEAKNA